MVFPPLSIQGRTLLSVHVLFFTICLAFIHILYIPSHLGAAHCLYLLTGQLLLGYLAQGHLVI